MTISRKLLLAALLPVVLAFVALGGVLYSYVSVTQLQSQQTTAIQIRTDLNELNAFARAYLQHHDQGTREQFTAKSDQTLRGLRGLAAHERYLARVEGIATDVRQMQSYFEDIVIHHQRGGPVSQEAQDRLSALLFIRSNEANARAAALVATISGDIVSRQRTILSLVVAATLLTAAALVAGLLALRSGIVRGLHALMGGTEKVGGGELGHRVHLSRNDELGDLSRSFDRMTERLQEVTVSRTELEHALQTTTLLLDAATVMATTLNMDGALRSLIEVVTKATGRKRVSVSLYDAGSGVAVVTSMNPGPGMPAGATFAIDLLAPQARAVVDQGRPAIVDYDDPALPQRMRERAKSLGYELIAIVPLVHATGVSGFFILDDPGERRDFSETEIQLASGIAAQAAVAIENARIFESEQRAVGYSAALNRIDAAVHSTLELDEIMARIVVEVTDSLGVDTSAVHIRREGTWEFAYAHQLPEELSRSRLRDDEAPLSARVIQASQAILVNDMSRDERADFPLMEQSGITSLAALSLIVRGRPLGVFYTGCIGRTKAFTPEDVDFLNKAALTLALAIQNARLYESERRIATKLQEALLALPDWIEGVEFGHAYHSATETARVGGDFYDIFELDQHHVGVTVGDVAGKGLDAAVLTSLAKNTIRAHATEKGKTPASILRLTNEVLYRSTPPETFVTLCFGILDRRDGGFVYASGGHTTTLMIKTTGAISKLPVTGPMLGVFIDAEFDQVEACMELDETLLLYTDGVTEARGAGGELYGEERLVEFLPTVGGAAAPGVVQGVISDVLTFSGGSLDDDLAIMAVKRVANPLGALTHD